jgi:hypothetical protein
MSCCINVATSEFIRANFLGSDFVSSVALEFLVLVFLFSLISFTVALNPNKSVKSPVTVVLADSRATNAKSSISKA